VTVPVASGGSHVVNVYAIDSTGNGNNPLLASRAVTVDTESFGHVDAVAQTTADNVRIEGWAIDPKTAAPIGVAVYIDGVPMGDSTASGERTDVGTVFPVEGSDHGFDITVPVATIGTHVVDVYALDSTGDGDNPLLGRTNVVVTSAAIA
jgi:hypothetical protein